VEDLRKNERRMRSVKNPNPRGDLSLLESPKSFARTTVSLNIFVRIVKRKRIKRRILILILSLRRKMVMHTFQIWQLM
jgi:hypothetical protein